MPKILFAVDENNKAKVLKIETSPDEHVKVSTDDINEIEHGRFIEDEDHSLKIYRANLVWIDMSTQYPDYEPDGYWEISNIINKVIDLREVI